MSRVYHLENTNKLPLNKESERLETVSYKHFNNFDSAVEYAKKLCITEIEYHTTKLCQAQERIRTLGSIAEPEPEKIRQIFPEDIFAAGTKQAKRR